MVKAQMKMDEFAFVLLAGIILIAILMVTWSTPTELPANVEPDSISLTVQKGTSTTYSLTITNATNITLSSTGVVSGWISFNKNSFDAKLQPVTVVVKINVPKTTMEGTWEGSIVINSVGGEKTVPVVIEVSSSPLPLSYNIIPLGDFSISMSEGEKVLDSEGNVVVSKGVFSESAASLIGTLNDEELSVVTDASLHLLLEDTNNLGNLRISLNNQEIYSGRPQLGELDIPIAISLLGKTNVITIKAASPGLMFWASTTYKFRTISFVVTVPGEPSQSFQFSLNQDQIDNFDHFQVSARLKSHSTPMRELSIKINDHLLYFEKPPLSFINVSVSNDLLGNRFYLASDNTITFSIESEGSFEIANAVLTAYYKY